MTLRHYVAVVGPGEAVDGETDAVAREVGRLLAEAGAVVVCGGLGGVMTAVARGARAGGGTVVGLLPGDDRAAANEYLSVALPTGLGQARNVLVVTAADAVIAVGMNAGTLSEVALAVRAGKPVVQVAAPLVAELAASPSYVAAGTARQAVDWILGVED